MFTAPLLLIAALSGAPATTAYTAVAPIAISACTLQSELPQANFAGLDIPTVNAVAISFVNRNEKAISSVSFDVSDGRTTNRIVDTGTFSTGTAIDHSFSTPSLSDAVSCSVRSVAFADGSTWQAQ